MALLKDLLISRLIKPKIVHRLPGRLRRHIPALQHIPKQSKELAAEIIEKIKFAEGISSTELNLVSGTILIHYKDSITNESKVLNWVEKLIALIVETEKKISGAPKDQQREMLNVLETHVKNADNNSVDIERKDKLFELLWK